MAQNQVLLRLSKSKNQNHPNSLIQVSLGNAPFVSESGTIIITLASNEIGTSDADTEALCAETETTATKQSHLLAIDIEQEFDDLASTDIAAELRAESENDEENDANETSLGNAVAGGIATNGYKDFPSKILDGCKLLYKGADLLDMISRFYRLECDQCE